MLLDEGFEAAIAAGGARAGGREPAARSDAKGGGRALKPQRGGDARCNACARFATLLWILGSLCGRERLCIVEEVEAIHACALGNEIGLRVAHVLLLCFDDGDDADVDSNGDNDNDGGDLSDDGHSMLEAVAAAAVRSCSSRR